MCVIIRATAKHDAERAPGSASWSGMPSEAKSGKLALMRGFPHI
ncbi:hypothetical protein HMPREF9004_1104 [Schaalia cardiffensis F0333]|uniref:Uncharacterized protein n=1 Tax=Schaalia cardiffensis F0333 TaxID=888050 RepID=N6W6K5_9ACTO|nr:hypothetical protein HMPREF9004_1104 [Schaalia cardiffensis F0333]